MITPDGTTAVMLVLFEEPLLELVAGLCGVALALRTAECKGIPMYPYSVLYSSIISGTVLMDFMIGGSIFCKQKIKSPLATKLFFRIKIMQDTLHRTY